MKLGIITDIHENISLLTDSLRLASEYKCDEIICLGDITGYDRRFYNYNSGRSARECLNLVRSACKWITAGNHDLFAARIFPVYSNGFKYPDNWFSLDIEQRNKLSSGKVWCYEGDDPNDLREEDIDYIKSIPEFIITDISGISCLFAHYLAPDYTGSTTVYIERESQMKHHWDIMIRNGVTYSFGGHSHNHHTGFAYISSGKFMKAFNSFHGDTFNIGNEITAVILPPLSGDKGRRGFSILDTNNLTLSIITSF
ncbi:MAG TPA: metallophosphoesterase [Bacteroidales bacterium]|nr:metallophosphoesterase [Bacteroidales bacterium]